MSENKFADDDKLRFRVHQANGVVSFFGCIGDTPDLAALDGVVTDKLICDFSQLAFASWIGLMSLGSYIQGKGYHLIFRSIPFKIYDSLRMMKCFEEQELESAELPLLDLASGRASFKMTDLRSLRARAEAGEDWLEPTPGQRLLVPSRYTFPDLMPQRGGGPLPVKVVTPQTDLVSFWLQYGAFCHSTIDISSVLVYAAKFNIMQILGEIKAKMASGEAALKIVDPKTNYTLVNRMDGMMLKIEASFDGLSEKIKVKLLECLAAFGDVTMKGSTGQFDANTFCQSLAASAGTTASLVDIAASCEECGSSIGGNMGALRVTQVLKNGLSAISKPNGETVTAIRDAFAIMDIMSEDDWPATRIIIMDEIEYIETLIGRCVVTLQGFDMMRQILEHRIHEMVLLVEAYKAAGADSLLDPELREQVLTKIGAHMVTEQEKAAFEFYLPDGFARFAQTDRIEPGDVLLF
jgi:hypothetical protein